MLTSLAYMTFPALLVLAAVGDLARFRIPNWISIALLVAFPVVAVTSGAPSSWTLAALAYGFGVLALGFILYAFGAFGGGDAKLLAAATPWIGPEALFGFLLAVAIAGGAMAVVLAAFRKAPAYAFYARTGWLQRLHERRREMPYGVAIAIGALFVAPGTRLFALAVGG